MEIKYLVAFLTRQIWKRISEQVMKALRITGCLNHMIWHNKHLKHDTKMKIYKSVVWIILAYYIETGFETIKRKQAVGVSEMKALKIIARKWEKIKREMRMLGRHVKWTLSR